MTKKRSVEYYWSSDDKMTKVVNGGTTVEYKYDLLGRRLAKRVNGGAWWWTFYDGLKVVGEGSNTSSNRIFYTLAPGAVGGIIYRDRYGTKYAYHYDRLGNVMAVTDGNGAAYALYTMDAFGNVLEKGTSTGYSSEHATDPQPYHLTTKEYDPDVGLYYFNARWYDPATGRFVSKASRPVEEEHQFGFCENNPVTGVDLDGGTVVIPPPGANPFDYWRCKECANRIFQVLMAGRLVAPNDPYNNLRHCIGSAMIAVQCPGGCTCAFIVGWGHEAQTHFRGDWWRDVKANRQGRACAGCQGQEPAEDIWCCCEKATGVTRPPNTKLGPL